MKFALLSLVAFAIGTSAAPTADTAVSWNRNFKCPNAYQQQFCRASNVHSRCVNGRFESDAKDTCGTCWCT